MEINNSGVSTDSEEIRCKVREGIVSDQRLQRNSVDTFLAIYYKDIEHHLHLVGFHGRRKEQLLSD